MTESPLMPFCHSWRQDQPGLSWGLSCFAWSQEGERPANAVPRPPEHLFPKTGRRSLPCSQPWPLPAGLQASTTRRKEPGLRSQGAWEEETGRRPDLVGGSEPRTVEMDLRERCLPLLATAGNSTARGGARKGSNTLTL